MSHRVAFGSSPEEMTGLTTSPSISWRRPRIFGAIHQRQGFRHLLWPKKLDSENRDRRAELVLMHRVSQLILSRRRNGEPSLVGS